MPYIAAENGILFTILLIVGGALLCYFSSMVLVDWSEKTGKYKYEDFAYYWWGERMSKLAGWWNVLALLGFSISYIIFIKGFIPLILEILLGEDNVPEILGPGQFKGELFWGTIYGLFIMLPFSLPKKVTSLEILSICGWLSAIYVTLWFICLFLFDSDLVPSKSTNFANASYFKLTYNSILKGIPLIMFSYMYQPVVPVLYKEMSPRNRTMIKSVLLYGTILLIIVYTFDSSFGYLLVVGNSTFVESLMEHSNILHVDLNSWAFKIAFFGLLITVFACGQINFLTAKSDFETLMFKRVMTRKQNIIVTTVLWGIWWFLAVMIPKLTDVMNK